MGPPLVFRHEEGTDFIILRTQAEAYNHLLSLWDSSSDYFREKFPNTRKEQFDKIAADSFKLPASYSSKILDVLNTFLPQNVKELIKKYPPYFVVVPKAFFEATKSPEQKHPAKAMYTPISPDIKLGTRSNLVLISDEFYEKLRKDPAHMIAIVSHEVLHYAKRLFAPKHKDSNEGLTEGITEFLALKATIDSGYKLRYSEDLGSVYPAEFNVAHLLSKLVGDEELKRAYFTDDYSFIRAKVDKLGGFGTWHTIISIIRIPNSITKEGYASLFDLLNELRKSAKIDPNIMNSEIRLMGKSD